MIGNLLQDLENFLPRIEDAFTSGVLKGIVLISPDFNLFTITTQLTYGYPVSFSYVFSTTMYGITYGAVFLVAGAAIFNRRDFI